MRILISGAGIAGPSLARFLAPSSNTSKPIHITILEKQPALLPHGQSIDLEGSARILIRKAGLDEAIRGKNTGEKGSVFINSRGKPCARFPLREDGSGISMTSPYEILRGDLAMVLYEATKDFENVEYLFGTCITKVLSNTNEDDEDDGVRVELSTGEVKDYDLLIAADGQWSKIRKQCFPDETIQVVDKNMFGAYWTFPRVEGDDNNWNIYHALDARILSTRPDPYGTMRACFTIMPSDKTVAGGKMTQREEWVAASRDRKGAQQDLVRRDFGGAGWQAERILRGLEEAPDFYFQRIAQIRMKKWYMGRVVCLGDAAYCPTSLTGMGTSLAILGAYVLAGELSEVIARGSNDGENGVEKGKGSSSAVSISDALEAYDKNFRPFVDEIQHIPSFIPGVAHPNGRLGRWALQTFLWSMGLMVQLPWFVTKSKEGDCKEDFKLPKYPTLGAQYA